MVTYEEIAQMIDHSLLKPTLTDQEIVEGCTLADQYQVASVCVRPSDVKLAKKVLANSPVLVTTVIGFPHGTTTTLTKVTEATEAIENGAFSIRFFSINFTFVEIIFVLILSLGYPCLTSQ